ncbi:ParB/RepB/Spo0J family partition protein [Clostridium chauvoei]|uniref:ParB/RepB/Spo0J family partition protein n=2 Tax=Clostridium chauvoei TaxID=46867 RepID=A0ABD4RJB9_9CLOT|nr:ParB/RepB/Spo0J family partition protein [Clostridium chauvoei]ATD56135.1 chromosome partitioning protein ParB [Clostridium chauvoei]ATD58625.1 chromosome partitioning protein ParB [Clostridium chauvoei]MBX7281430.1 ParB/RepB/Spo0J family partition protein [Clostridium chauvoei]MBX7283950.1 ParB/RepB/Spo0J family partition protein [Clostridium chauvoei]MBX7286166.1 ParB/RepB/Spo0J family partition protein [Clostridium chauvoei]
MSKKFALGKGLGALIPEDMANNENLESGKSLIPINLIKSNNEQPRKFFDDDKIAELAESIKHHGIIQPIILKKDNNNYIIVAGERRWRAAKLVGLKEIPAIIMNLTEKDILEISLIENIQRQDLNPIEEAIAYKKLLNEFQLTQEELSKRIGKSRVAISNTMRLMNLCETVQQYLIDGVITEGHGRVLLVITDENLQCEVAQKVIDEKLSVRELEKLIKLLSKPKKNIERKIDNNPYYKDVTQRLQDFLGTKVNISNKNNKGKIEIEYYSDEDLQRILEIINL